MIYASVCSGVEAASLAWIPLGWKAAWFSEIEPFPCAILKHRFPEVPNLGDMTKIKVETIENETGKLQRFKNESGADVVVPGGVDLLVGGTPCQGFSVAGKQDGLDDPRSALCLAYCELLETMRPRWFVWENVPGVFSANQGDDFRAFLRKIDEIGYSVAWRVLDAQYVRVDGFPRAIPQRRRRVFVVGHFGSDFRCPAGVLFEPESVFRTTPPRRSKGSGVARSLTASTGGASGKEQQHTFISGDGRPLNAIKVIATGQANAETATDICVNLTCNHEAPIVCGYGTGHGYWQSGDIAGTLRAGGGNGPSRPSNIICAGFSGGQGAKAGGIGYEDEVAPTIKASSSGSNSVPDVLCVHGSQDPVTQHELANTVGRNNGLENCIVIYANHGNDCRITESIGVSPTITSQAGTGGNNLPLVQYIPIDMRNTIRKPKYDKKDQQGVGFGVSGRLWDESGVNPTLNQSMSGGIIGASNQELFSQNANGLVMCVAIAENVIGRQIKNGGNGIGVLEELAYTQNATGVMGVCHNAFVRRLLPVECERLMGFPDNWTRIPWRSKPEEECPDSHRYKACGNSMCVNVMRWIGMRIELTERKLKWTV